MKKLIITLSSVSMLFVACKKDYTCECTSGNTTTKHTIKSATKRQAKANCYSSYYEFTVLGVTTKVESNCNLK